MVFPVFDPAPNFNFTVTMWDVPKTPGDIGVGTSVASAFLNVATSLLFGGFAKFRGWTRISSWRPIRKAA